MQETCQPPRQSPEVAPSPGTEARDSVAPSTNGGAGKGCGAFTLIEMLVVMFILSILISMLAVAVSKAKAMARQTDCKSSMRQFGVAILVYRGDHRGSNPAWLSSLYPSYVDDRHLYVCRSDRANPRGTGRTRPEGLNPYTGQDLQPGQSFPETIDNQSNPNWGLYGQNTNITACSYFYEFSAAPAPTSWNWTGGPTNLTWCQYKEHQLLSGDKNSNPPNTPYSTSRMPIIRCYHHYAEGQLRTHANDETSTVLWTDPPVTKPITINVAYAGNVYVGPLLWEGALLPGER